MLRDYDVGPTWWRWAGFPTPDEWQALWAFIAVVGTGAAVLLAYLAYKVAKKQLKELIASNRELARSNNQLEASNLELLRPRVVVYYELRRLEARDPRNSYVQAVDLIVENIGNSEALDIRLKIAPYPESEPFKSQWQQELFTGKTNIPQLMPGQRKRYLLKDDLPRRPSLFEQAFIKAQHSVSVTYVGPGENAAVASEKHLHRWEVVFEIDIEASKHELVAPDALVRISKDIQQLGYVLKKSAYVLSSDDSVEERARSVGARPRRRRLGP